MVGWIKWVFCGDVVLGNLINFVNWDERVNIGNNGSRNNWGFWRIVLGIREFGIRRKI